MIEIHLCNIHPKFTTHECAKLNREYIYTYIHVNVDDFYFTEMTTTMILMLGMPTVMTMTAMTAMVMTVRLGMQRMLSLTMVTTARLGMQRILVVTMLTMTAMLTTMLMTMVMPALKSKK